MILSQLFKYPLKSARGIELRELDLGDRGPAGDRRWMLVGLDNVFLSQRTLPRMALIRVAERDGGLVFDAPEMPSLHVATPTSGQRIRAAVWDDTVEVLACGTNADAWFSAFLNRRCRLVHQPEDSLRPVEPEYSKPGDIVSLADAFPLLLIGQGSLDSLNEKLSQPITMVRFRPNLVISGPSPHEEDRWRRIRIGEIEFDVVKPCSRCSIPAVNPETGALGREPTRTLARYRRFGKKILFGQNVNHRGQGKLHLGDPVVVLQVNDEQNRTAMSNSPEFQSRRARASRQ